MRWRPRGRSSPGTGLDAREGDGARALRNRLGEIRELLGDVDALIAAQRAVRHVPSPTSVRGRILAALAQGPRWTNELVAEIGTSAHVIGSDACALARQGQIRRVTHRRMGRGCENQWAITELALDAPKPRRLPRHIPVAVKRAVWARDGGRCVQCGSGSNTQYDHVIPVARGGSSTAANVQILCAPCNGSKGTKIQ